MPLGEEGDCFEHRQSSPCGMIERCCVPHMSQQLQADSMRVDRHILHAQVSKTDSMLRLASRIRGIMEDRKGGYWSRTYVLFSPLGLRNHEATEKTAMKMMLTRSDHLAQEVSQHCG